MHDIRYKLNSKLLIGPSVINIDTPEQNTLLELNKHLTCNRHVYSCSLTLHPQFSITYRLYQHIKSVTKASVNWFNFI